MFDDQYMQMALDLARQANAVNEVPVGAVIVDRNFQVIARAYNNIETNKQAIAHAEMLAIAQASEYLDNKYLIDCAIYVTLEPCSMCIAAISLAKISKVYFGAHDIKAGGVESASELFLDSKVCYHRPEIYSGILANEAKELLQQFFRKLRI